MNELNKHYRLLLGLDESWHVKAVDLSIESKRVEITLEHLGGRLNCPECGVDCPRADLAPERTWRHLDTMQFESILKARTPRCDCKSCGVKTIEVPWAGKHSRFTLMFEAFAIEVMQACGNVKQAAALLRLDWDTVHTIMERGVNRGLERRNLENIKHVGIDEKSFLSGQNYVSVMSDIDSSRVLEVAEGRTEASADKLWKSLARWQRGSVQAVSMDMWQAFISSTERHVPLAAIVFDRFHISKHLNDAVDQIRRQENKALRAEGDTTLTGTKQLWLFNLDNLSFDQLVRFHDLKEQTLKTSRAWAIKEQFRHFWDCFYKQTAEGFFDKWYSWASRSQLQPIVAKAKMLKRHLARLLTYFEHKITNATSEGFNSKIQLLKANARGFRSFTNYRLRILFFCGKLDLMPDQLTH